MMRRWLHGICLALLCMTLHVSAWAAQTNDDEALTQRADALAHTMRCLVCQNQSLAESDAPLAHDMRRIIRQQLAEGRSEAQVLQFFQDRYGEFVRYDPPFEPTTWLLWLGPFVLLALGALTLVRTLRRRRAQPQAPLGQAERERAARFMEDQP